MSGPSDRVDDPDQQGPTDLSRLSSGGTETQPTRSKPYASPKNTFLNKFLLAYLSSKGISNSYDAPATELLTYK